MANPSNPAINTQYQIPTEQSGQGKAHGGLVDALFPVFFLTHSGKRPPGISSMDLLPVDSHCNASSSYDDVGSN